MRAAGREPAMPPVSLSYLLGILWEIGPALPGAMGPVPLTHMEIAAWQFNMRRQLEPGEVSMLRRLSGEWVAMSQKAEDPHCEAPWATEDAAATQRSNVTANLRASMRGLG